MTARWLQTRVLTGLLLLVPMNLLADTRNLPHVAFVAGKPSHGYGEHEANAGGELLVADLNASGLVSATLHRNGWPASGINPKAAAIVLYMDGDTGHEALQHLEELSIQMARGTGLVAIHFATHVPEQAGEAHFAHWLGGYYHSDTSTNPIWTANVSLEKSHPVSRGVMPFAAYDEFYFNIRFANDPGLTPLLMATPPDIARAHVPHPRRILYVLGGTPPPQVLANKGRRETIAWTLERPGGGRSFGFTGGHYHWNWGLEHYRRLVLNGIVWSAGADIPPNGLKVTPLGMDELMQGLDSNPPWRFSADTTAAQFGLH